MTILLRIGEIGSDEWGFGVFEKKPAPDQLMNRMISKGLDFSVVKKDGHYVLKRNPNTFITEREDEILGVDKDSSEADKRLWAAARAYTETVALEGHFHDYIMDMSGHAPKRVTRFDGKGKPIEGNFRVTDMTKHHWRDGRNYESSD